jgi:hypothetical protein
MPTPHAGFRAVLQTGPPAASKLFALIVRQATHGPIHPKAEGVATPPEILEACGLDVGEFYQLLDWLVGHGLVEVGGEYPFEEIRLTTVTRTELSAESNSAA